MLVMCGKLPTPITSFIFIFLGFGIAGVSFMGCLIGDGPELSIEESDVSRFRMSLSFVRLGRIPGEYKRLSDKSSAVGRG